MALYLDLSAILGDASLTARCKIAGLVAADTVRQESSNTANHSFRLVWASKMLKQPDEEANRIVLAVVAQNASATVAQIIGASDSTLQTAVNGAIDLLAA